MQIRTSYNMGIHTIFTRILQAESWAKTNLQHNIIGLNIQMPHSTLLQMGIVFYKLYMEIENVLPLVKARMPLEKIMPAASVRALEVDTRPFSASQKQQPDNNHLCKLINDQHYHGNKN